MLDTTLKLPEKTVAEQRRSKILWNLNHSSLQPDFYTIGYSGRPINDFINSLINAGVATLVDVRYSPVSRFKPEFSKGNLTALLGEHDINYVHKPDWGVPRDIRALSIGKPDRNDIWTWYDANVLPTVVKKNMDEFFNSMVHPVAFMCTEYDPAECHRHRIFLGLEGLGLKGRDL